MSEQTGSETGRITGTRQLIGSLVITLISVGMLVGGFLLSQLETSGIHPQPTQTIVTLPLSPPASTPTPTSSPPALPSPLATETTIPPTPSPSASPTLPSALIPSCPQPPGWIVYTVQQGDTLTSLAWSAGTTALALMEANCLSTTTIYPGQRIYLPHVSYASPTPKPCPPLNWVVYIVQPGDTLYSLSLRCGVSIETIRQANCMSGYTIYAGQALYLPSLPPTLTPSRMPSYTPTPTTTPLPTSTPTPTTTESPTPIPTTAAPTFTPSPMPTHTATHTPTYVPPLTDTPSPTSTFTPTPTPIPTESPTSTYTPTPTPTESPTSTSTSAFISVPPS